MPDQHHGQAAAASGDDLHEPFEPVQGPAVQVVGFVDEQGDGLAEAQHELSQLTLAFFALGRDRHLLFARQVVEQGGDKGRHGRAVGVDRQAFGHLHLVFAGDLVLQAV